MEKYNVTVCYSTYVNVDVYADSEQEAIERATVEAAMDKYADQLVENCVETGVECSVVGEDVVCEK